MMMQPLSHHLGKGGPLSEAHAWRDRQLVVRYQEKFLGVFTHKPFVKVKKNEKLASKKDALRFLDL